MSNFYTILTNIGAALHANAQVQQTTVAWTHMALGDGNGNPVVPQQTQAGLVREVHRLPITSLEQHPDNPNWIVVEAVVPGDVGGWTVRETALYGGAGGGSCIAVGNYPATYKPVLAEGAVREMVMRMVIEVSSVATVKLVIDPAVAIASRKWVESLVATPAKAGLVKLATKDEAKEGLRDDVAVTPEGLGAALNAADFSDELQQLQVRIAALEQMPNGLGINQNYVTFTAAQRPANTWFENLSTRPKHVSVIRPAGGNNTWQLEVGTAGIGKIVSFFGATGPTSVYHTLQGIVPPGSSYRIVFIAGATDYTVQELTA